MPFARFIERAGGATSGEVWADPQGRKVVLPHLSLVRDQKLLQGSVESRQSPAGHAVSQPKLCAEDELRGALGARAAAAARHHRQASPGCWLPPGRPA